MKQMNGQTILLGALVLVLALVSFNLYFSKQDAEQENQRLTKQVEHLSAKEKQSEALYTQTEAFIEATFEGDALRYILPVQPSSMPDGWQFKPNRDYLQPIEQGMLGIMDEIKEGLWKQNPGW